MLFASHDLPPDVEAALREALPELVLVSSLREIANRFADGIPQLLVLNGSWLASRARKACEWLPQLVVVEVEEGKPPLLTTAAGPRAVSREALVAAVVKAAHEAQRADALEPLWMVHRDADLDIANAIVRPVGQGVDQRLTRVDSLPHRTLRVLFGWLALRPDGEASGINELLETEVPDANSIHRINSDWHKVMTRAGQLEDNIEAIVEGHPPRSGHYRVIPGRFVSPVEGRDKLLGHQWAFTSRPVSRMDDPRLLPSRRKAVRRVRRYLTRGDSVRLIGPRGSGCSSVVELALIELEAQRWQVVRIDGDSGQLASILETVTRGGQGVAGQRSVVVIENMDLAHLLKDHPEVKTVVRHLQSIGAQASSSTRLLVHHTLSGVAIDAMMSSMLPGSTWNFFKEVVLPPVTDEEARDVLGSESRLDKLHQEVVLEIAGPVLRLVNEAADLLQQLLGATGEELEDLDFEGDLSDQEDLRRWLEEEIQLQAGGWLRQKQTSARLLFPELSPAEALQKSLAVETLPSLFTVQD
jgi:hypothetical protein